MLSEESSIGSASVSALEAYLQAWRCKAQQRYRGGHTDGFSAGEP